MSQSAEPNEFRRTRYGAGEEECRGDGLIRIKKEPSKCQGLSVLYYNLDHSTDSLHRPRW